MSDLDPFEHLSRFTDEVRKPQRRTVSLEEAARYLRKSRRTLQRWCARGIFPGAYRTPGGHWRISVLKHVGLIKARASGYSRMSWEQRFGLAPGAYADRIDLALAGLDENDIRTGEIPENHDAYNEVYGFDRYDRLNQGVKTTGMKIESTFRGRETSLILLLPPILRSLCADGHKVTIANVSRRLGISRSHFYRRAAQVPGGLEKVQQFLARLEGILL